MLSFDTSVTINGEERYLEFFQATIGVGTQNWPCIQLVTHKAQDAENGMLRLSSGDIAKEMSARQSVLFEERNDTDASIKILSNLNGTPNNFEFEGFTSGPSYSFSAHNVELSDSIIPEYTKINFLNLSIYKDKINTDASIARPTLQETKTICKLTAAMVEKWMKEHSQGPQGALNDDAIRVQHDINKRFVDYWSSLLNNSDENFGWKNIEKITATIGDTSLKRTLWSIMCQSSGSFSTVIDRFAEEFQCLYVPGWNDIGVFLSRQDLYKNPERLKVDPISLSFNSANGFGLMPTSYLGIENAHAVINTDDQNFYRFNRYICVPRGNVGRGGQVIRMLGPNWMPPVVPMSAAPTGSNTEQQAPIISRIEKHIDKVVNLMKQWESNVQDCVQEWGIAAYTYLSLVDSTAEIYVPLNFNLQIGKRYEVVNQNGDTLFKGFLNKLTHTLSTKSRSPMATTAAQFSHIEIGDFQLKSVMHD